MTVSSGRGADDPVGACPVQIRWDEYDGRETRLVGAILMPAAELEAASAIRFVGDLLDDLGWFQMAAVRLDCGTVYGLIQHDGSPVTELYGDPAACDLVHLADSIGIAPSLVVRAGR